MTEYLIEDEPLLNEKQVAAITGLSPRTLQTWRLRGGGPEFLKLGTGVRYRRDEVVAWMKRSAKSSTSDVQGRS